MEDKNDQAPTHGKASMLSPIDVAAPPEGRMVRRGGQTLVSVMLQGGVRFLTSFLVGRFTNPATLALVTSGVSLANLLALAWPTTVGAAASRFVARARGEGSDINAVARFMAVRTMQAAFVLSLCALPIWHYLGGTVTEGLVVALLVATFSGYTFSRGVHYGAGQTLRQLKWDLVTSAAAIAGVVVVLMTPLPSMVVLLALALAYGVYTVACWPWRARGRLDREVRREIDEFVAWGSAGTVASAGFAQFAMLVAVGVAGRAEAGQFAAAMVLAAPAAMLANSLAQVLFPSMAEAFGRGDAQSVRRQLDQATYGLTAVMVLIFGVLVVGARPLVYSLWGSRYADAAIIIPLLLLPGMIRSIAAPSQGAISISSRGGIAFSSLASIGGALLGAAVWVLMPDSWGVVGVAAGYALGTTTIALALYLRAWQRHDQRWGLLTVTLAAATAVAAVASWQLSARSPSMTVDYVAVVAFVLVWCGVQQRQLRRIVAHLRRRR